MCRNFSRICFCLTILGVEGYCLMLSHTMTHSDSIGMPQMSDRCVAEACTYTTLTRQTFVPSAVFEPADSGRRVTREIRLRPRDHRDRLLSCHHSWDLLSFGFLSILLILCRRFSFVIFYEYNNDYKSNLSDCKCLAPKAVFFFSFLIRNVQILRCVYLNP